MFSLYRPTLNGFKLSEIITAVILGLFNEVLSTAELKSIK
jgi:hypothetical protein